VGVWVGFGWRIELQTVLQIAEIPGRFRRVLTVGVWDGRWVGFGGR
jgi:hypothetical protein